VIHAAPCQTVEVTLENTDKVRHDFMIRCSCWTSEGPRTETGRFVTPDHDATLEFHCHVPTHEEMGMRGLIVVGRGSPGIDVMIAALGHRAYNPEAGHVNHPPEQARSRVGDAQPEAAHLFRGTGILKAVDRRAGRIIVAHKEIPGFMAAMTMSYLIEPADLLAGFKSGDRVNFTIDADKREIVSLQYLSGPQDRSGTQ
jgi:Cu(I)/Ag(I) efflux system periplasmic protein CusF